jgi:hypothetical protein
MKSIYKFGRAQCQDWIGSIKNKKRVVAFQTRFLFFLYGKQPRYIPIFSPDSGWYTYA